MVSRNDATAPMEDTRLGKATPSRAAPAPLRELEPGTRCDQYVVERKIGEGGMGAVYAGSHPIIGKRVAIKVLNAMLCDDENLQRFVREAQAVNRIAHKNIVDIFAYGSLPDGRPYFVMEYLEGETLSRFMRNQPMPTYRQAFDILRAVGSALAAAHAAQVVHRDLKPDNIFIANTKPDPTVKLLDFGIAKLLGTDAEMSRTATGAAIGTPSFMSPEQCRGLDIDARADIYAFGVIMYVMFGGRRPIDGPAMYDVMDGHIRKTPPSLRSFVRVSDPLDQLIMQCLAKDPAARPQTMEAVVARLEELSRKEDTLDEVLPWVAADRTAERIVVELEGRPSLRVPSVVDEPALPSPARGSRSRQMVLGVGAAGLVGAALAIGFAMTRRPAPLPTEITQPPIANAPASPIAPAPPTRGQLELRTQAQDATWTVDGTVRDQHGGTLRVELEPGAHVVRVEAAGFAPHEERVEIKAGAELVRDLRLSELPAPSSKPRRDRTKPTTTRPRVDENGVLKWDPTRR